MKVPTSDYYDVNISPQVQQDMINDKKALPSNKCIDIAF